MLFDSSAIINLFRENKAMRLLEGRTIDLAFYEIGNAVRRQVDIEKSVTQNEGLIILEALYGVISAMKLVRLTSLANVLKVASSEKLTFYDASYLSVALEEKHDLVTDDRRLYDAAKKHLKVWKSEDLS